MFLSWKNFEFAITRPTRPGATKGFTVPMLREGVALGPEDKLHQ
jgi:hypothetical protein